MTEHQLRKEIVKLALSLFNRGYSSGAAGNISARLPDGSIISTPTNSSLGELRSDSLSKSDAQGRLISGQKATKEIAIHQAFYQYRPSCQAVIHLHSPYLTALSCLADLDSSNCLPAITPYYVMRIGKLPLIPYFSPGNQHLAEEVARLAPTHTAVLLANHGPVITGRSLTEAHFNAEELEDAARLYLTLLPHRFNTLSDEQIEQLNQRYAK